MQLISIKILDDTGLDKSFSQFDIDLYNCSQKLKEVYNDIYGGAMAFLFSFRLGTDVISKEKERKIR